MITYTSSDIIKRATQIADLENSDFISFNEKIALLNESYVALYQKLINKGDNAFLRYINTNKSIIDLPQDFYQLKAVLLNNNGYLQPIKRRPQNQNDKDLSYEIINNTLKINGHYSGGSISIEYYPTPVTLTFPSEKLSIPFDNVLAMHNDWIITGIYNNDELTGLMLNNLNDNSINVELNGNKLIHVADDYVVTKGDKYYLFNLKTGKTIETVYIPASFKSRMFLYNDSKLLMVENNSIAYNDLPAIKDKVDLIMFSDDLKHFIYKTDKVKIDDKEIELKQNPKHFYQKNESVIITTDSNYVVDVNYNGDYQEIIKNDCIIDVIKFDDNTGYGYLTQELNGYYVTSFFDDTELNFPNQMYFTLMAYLLAISFKIKQGSDISGLQLSYEKAEETFYDTLSNDDWNYTRITNVY